MSLHVFAMFYGRLNEKYHYVRVFLHDQSFEMVVIATVWKAFNTRNKSILYPFFTLGCDVKYQSIN